MKNEKLWCPFRGRICFSPQDGQTLGRLYGFLTVWGTDCRVGFASSQ